MASTRSRAASRSTPTPRRCSPSGSRCWRRIRWSPSSGRHRSTSETSMPTTRYVKASSKTFGTSAGGFTSPSSPAKHLADALKVVADGDTIQILDTEVYAEGELVVDRPLTIESKAAATVRPTDPAFRPEALPRIRPRAARVSRVFRIQAAGKGRNLLKGRVVLRGLTIEGGLAKNTP